MKDKSIPLLNNSLLMHWVADYEKSMRLIEEAERVLKEVGLDVELIPQKLATWSTDEYSENVREDTLLSVGNEKKEIKTKREKVNTREQLIATQASRLYELSEKKAKSIDKKKNIKQNEVDPIVTSHSERLSCLSIRTDILNYEVRLVVDGRFKWRKKSFENIELDGFYISCISNNSHESVFHIENRLLSGVIYFSSLGLAEGRFYEQEGVRAPDRSELLIIIVKSVAQKVFGINSKI